MIQLSTIVRMRKIHVFVGGTTQSSPHLLLLTLPTNRCAVRRSMDGRPLAYTLGESAGSQDRMVMADAVRLIHVLNKTQKNYVLLLSVWECFWLVKLVVNALGKELGEKHERRQNNTNAVERPIFLSQG